MRVGKPLAIEKKYGFKKMGVGMAWKLCYPFCKKGRNKILHFNVLLCVLRRTLGSLCKKLREKII